MRYLIGSERFFLDVPGGAQRVAWDLAKLARDAGHDVSMLCGSDAASSETPDNELVDGIEVVRYRVPPSTRLTPVRRQLHTLLATRAARHFRSQHWDVVHGHAPLIGSIVYRLARGARRIHTVHSPAVMENAINWSGPGVMKALKRQLGLPLLAREERRQYLASEVIHTLSDYTRRELARLYGSAVEARCQTVPGWVPRLDVPLTSKLAARARLGWPADARIVYSLRRMVPRMGLDVLVDALHQLDDASVLGILAGDGPIRKTLEARAQAGASARRIRFLGRISDEEASLAYSAADVFVVPSRELECFGLILLEAMSHGCPVIASTVGGMPEVLGPIFPEGLVSPGDPTALATTLRRFFSGELVSKSGDALIAAVNESHGWHSIAPRYLELLFPTGSDARRG